MRVALASIDMGSNDAALRKTAVATLAEALQPEAIALLEKASAKGENGQYVHEDTEFAASSEAALKAMQTKVDLFKFLENCFWCQLRFGIIASRHWPCHYLWCDGRY